MWASIGLNGRLIDGKEGGLRHQCASLCLFRTRLATAITDHDDPARDGADTHLDHHWLLPLTHDP